MTDKFEHRGYTVRIEQSESGDSPREWSNVSKLVLSHGRYNVPNEVDFDFDAYDGWAQAEQALRDEHDAFWVLPVWGYDHSGFAIKAGERTYPFSDEWDSGQLGFVIVTNEAVRSEYVPSGAYPTPEAWADALAKGEVETYDDYTNGRVYGYIVEDANGEHVDSLWDIYGYDYAVDEAKAAVDAEIDYRQLKGDDDHD